jgi:hypothetical protein
VHPTQVFVAVLQAGAELGQLVSLKQATHTPVCRLQYVPEAQLASLVHAAPPSAAPEEEPLPLELDELASGPPDDEVVASPPSSPAPDEPLASDASSSRPESSPLSPEESVPELEPGDPLDDPELLPPPLEPDEPLVVASGPGVLPIVEVLEPPPHPTATTTATRQPSPVQALKAFIRDSPEVECKAPATPARSCDVGLWRNEVTRNSSVYGTPLAGATS